MPKGYSDLHDAFLLSYLQSYERKFEGIERTVYCRNKSGYLIPSTLITKVIPHLKEGI